MKRWTILIVGVLLLAPSLALAAAEQLTNTYLQISNTSEVQNLQLIRCVAGGGDDTPAGGEDCEAGDWSKPVDARNFNYVTLQYQEYSAAGSSTAKLWSCEYMPGGTTSEGGSVPGLEDPASAPTAADPDPICVSLDDAAGATVDGLTTGNQGFTLEGKFGFIIGEIHACSSCDSTMRLSVGR